MHCLSQPVITSRLKGEGSQLTLAKNCATLERPGKQGVKKKTRISTFKSSGKSARALQGKTWTPRGESRPVVAHLAKCLGDKNTLRHTLMALDQVWQISYPYLFNTTNRLEVLLKNVRRLAPPRRGSSPWASSEQRTWTGLPVRQPGKTQTPRHEPFQLRHRSSARASPVFSRFKKKKPG
jgi:hypothetical protein